MIARSHPVPRRARVRTRPYSRNGLVDLLIDDELERIGPAEAEGAHPLRPEEVATPEIEDPAAWFARDAEVHASFDRLARRIAARRG